jgi:ABC-2 type transport system ATP-binding protein
MGDAATGAAISVRNLTKRYPQSKTNAVDGVSFEVERSGIFGLLGPNGAGKTTIIGVLTTAVVPTGGEASIMDHDVVHDQIRVKQRIAVVPQRSNLDRSLLVREILTFHAAYHGVPRREREAHADELLKELGLYDRRNEKADRYSGGMAQRLMIARALMHKPDVLFLDEPTNNLDPQSRLFLWERIRALNEQGLTILLTTHDMDEADQLCQRIAIMDLGKILVNDTPAELKKLIPGGNSLELRVETGDAAPLTERFNALPGVTRVEAVPATGAEAERDVTSFHVYAAEAGALVGEAAQAILESGARVRDISVRQATLEEVYIYLTGKHLR